MVSCLLFLWTTKLCRQIILLLHGRPVWLWKPSISYDVYVKIYFVSFTESLSPQSPSDSSAAGGATAGGSVFPQLELLEATHRGLYRFQPRHHDEIEIDIGDPIYVQKEADDLWCEGKWYSQQAAIERHLLWKNTTSNYLIQRYKGIKWE